MSEGYFICPSFVSSRDNKASASPCIILTPEQYIRLSYKSRTGMTRSQLLRRRRKDTQTTAVIEYDCLLGFYTM
jgi:hypothetical protein